MATNQNLKDIQSMLDDSKEEIPEGVYLGLSNLLKKSYDTEQKEADEHLQFYKLTCLYNCKLNFLFKSRKRKTDNG
jgi:hypothetical protein